MLFLVSACFHADNGRYEPPIPTRPVRADRLPTTDTLAQKIERENEESRKRMAREAARPKGHPVSTDALRGYFDTPDARRHPEKAARVRARIAELDAEEAKGQCGEKAEAEQSGPRRRQRRPGQAPRLGPWIRVYGIVCPRCHAVSGELCHRIVGFGPTSRSR